MNSLRTFFAIFAICAALFLWLSGNAHAQSMDESIDAVQRSYRDAGDIQANFTQKTFVKILEKDVIKKGKLYYKTGGKFRIQYDGKNEKNYVSNGSMLWVFVPGDESSLVTYKVSDETVPKEALSFLSGFDNIRKDFKISPSKAFTDLKNGESAFYLTPKSKKSQFKALDAKFNGKNLLEDLEVHNLSGNVSDYHFSNIKTSAGLKDDLFSHGSGKATPDTLPQ